LFRTSGGVELSADKTFAVGAELLTGLVVVAPTVARQKHRDKKQESPYQCVSGSPSCAVYLKQHEIESVKTAFAQVLGGRQVASPPKPIATKSLAFTQPKGKSVAAEYMQTFGWRQSSLEPQGWRYLKTTEHGDQYGHPTDSDKRATAAVVVGSDNDGTLRVYHANVPGLPADDYQIDQFLAATRFGGDLSATHAFMADALKQQRQTAGVVTRVAEPADGEPQRDFDDWSYFGLGEPPEIIKATALERSDGNGLAYHDGLTNVIFGDPAAGKSWLVTHEIAKTLHAGQNALVVELDQEPGRVMLHRLYKLGVPAELLRDPERIRYSNVQDSEQMNRILSWADRFAPRVVVVDSLNGLVALNGGDTNSTEAIDKAWNSYIAPMTQIRDIGIFITDHLPKGTATGRNKSQPIGSVRKSAKIRGSSLRIEQVATFGVGRLGTAEVHVLKDGEGQVGGLITPDKGTLVAIYELDASQDKRGQLEPATVFSRLLTPSGDSRDRDLEKRMKEISETLQKHGAMTRNKLQSYVGRSKTTKRALESLLLNKYVVEQKYGGAGARTKELLLVKPYQSADEWSVNG
jgi:hypothetical protein